MILVVSRTCVGQFRCACAWPLLRVLSGLQDGSLEAELQIHCGDLKGIFLKRVICDFAYFCQLLQDEAKRLWPPAQLPKTAPDADGSQCSCIVKVPSHSQTTGRMLPFSPYAAASYPSAQGTVACWRNTVSLHCQGNRSESCPEQKQSNMPHLSPDAVAPMPADHFAIHLCCTMSCMRIDKAV